MPGELRRKRWDMEKCGPLCTALFLGFTFFVFGPLQMYITNAGEFFFELSDIWWICIAIFAAFFALVTVLGLLLKGKARELYCCLLWGVALGLYIQGNFITTNYGTLDGAIDWGVYEGVGAWNTLLWLGCVLLPFLLYIGASRIWGYIRNYVSLGIITVQIITLAVLLVTTKIEGSSECQLTNLKKLDLSNNKNIIVFVVDAYDSKYFSDFIEKHSEYKETVWKDFVYYPNTVGGGARTVLGMPQILTGKNYTSDCSYTEYLEDSYRSAKLYDILQKSGFDIGIYTNGTYMSSEMSDYVVNLNTDKKRVDSYPALAYYLYRFTACRYFPHELKKSIWMYSGDFDAAADNSGSDESPYIIDDALFYKNLSENGITVQDNTNVFRLYHLMGAHQPYTLDANALRDPSGTSLDEQQVGVIHILETYFNQMEELGIYDDANIIILADHGEIDYLQNPVLLIKKRNETKEFSVSDLPVSYENLHPTIISLAQEGAVSEQSIFELTQSDNQERYFYRLPSNSDAVVEYVVRGNAANPENVYETGRIISAFGNGNETVEPYRLGTMLYFDARATGKQYTKEGLSGTETTHTWTEGHDVVFSVPFEEPVSEDIFVSISAGAEKGHRVWVYVNHELLNIYRFYSDQLDFIIPKELLGEDNVTIRLELPDADVPGNGDPRILGLALRSMVIRERQDTDEESEIIMPYQIGDKIVFTDSQDGRKYFLSGVSYIENDYAWSLGTSGQMAVKLPENVGGLTAEFQFQGIYASPQTLVISGGGQVLYESEIESVDEPIRFDIPSECITDDWLLLDLEYPDACSPLSLGDNEDTRVLAFRFYSICFSSQEPLNQA